MPPVLTWMSLPRFVRWREVAFGEDEAYAIATYEFIINNAKAGELRSRVVSIGPRGFAHTVEEACIKVKEDKVVAPKKDESQWQ